MAILQKWHVSVEIDGKAVQELEPNGAEGQSNDRQPNAQTRYIEIKTLSDFAIRIGSPKAFELKGNAVVADIFFDGVCYAHKLFDKHSVSKGARILTAREKVIEGQEFGPPGGSSMIRPFQFGSVQGHTATAAALDLELIPRLGTIEVKLSHFRKVRFNARKPNLASDTNKANPIVPCDTPYLRRLGLSYVVKLGAERSHKRRKPWVGQRLGEVIATFLFKYRSHHALQDLGVIARSPSPEPPGEKPVEEWTVKELRSYVRKVQTALQDQRSVTPSIDEDVKDELAESKEDPVKSDDVKSQDRAEQTRVFEATKAIKRELPDAAIVLDLEDDLPVRKRARVQPGGSIVPAGVEVIVLDEDEGPLFM